MPTLVIQTVLRIRALIILGAVSLVCGALLAADKPVEGDLCFMEGAQYVDVSSCTTVKGERFEVDAANEARRFMWLARNGKTLVADLLDAGKTTVDLPGDRGLVRLGLRGSSDRGWPSRSTITLTSGQLEWKLSIPGKLVDHLEEFRVPYGRYDVRIAAEHHDHAARTGIEVTKKTADLGVIALGPLPRFTATVTRKDGTPLAGAALIDNAGKAVGSADHLGRVAFEAECTEKTRVCALPDRFTIEYPGLAGSRVLVTDQKKDFDAGRVILGIGGILELTVVRKTEESFPVNVEVAEEPSRRMREEPRTIAKATIAADEDRIRIEKLPAGTSSLYLRGDDPDEVLSKMVEIREGELTREEIDIRPTRLDMHVLLGDESLPGAKVTVSVPHGKPNHDVTLDPTDEDGHVTTTVWESGMLVALAEKDDLEDMVFFPVGDATRQDVEIRLSKTVIRGRIYNSETGEPLAKVSARYQWKSATAEGGAKFSGVETDDDGRFEITGVRPGTHTVLVRLPDYPPAEASIETTSADVLRTLDVPVSPGERFKLETRWDDGQPIPAATIVELAADRRSAQKWTTDGSGIATIPMAEGSTKELWLVPHEGSFAFTTIAARDSKASVVIARPAGALVVHTVDGAGSPTPSGHLGIRFGGHVLNYYVKSLIARDQGIPARTGSDGSVALRGFPPGQYDIWAVQFDGNDIIVDQPFGDQKVESFFYAGGEQTVTVVSKEFERRQ